MDTITGIFLTAILVSCPIWIDGIRKAVKKWK